MYNPLDNITAEELPKKLPIQAIYSAAQVLSKVDELLEQYKDDPTKRAPLEVQRQRQETLFDETVKLYADVGGINVTHTHDITDEHGVKEVVRESPLIQALRHDDLGAVKVLLAKGAAIGASLPEGTRADVVPRELVLGGNNVECFKTALDAYLATGKKPNAINLIKGLGEKFFHVNWENKKEDPLKNISEEIDYVIGKLGPVDLPAAVENGDFTINTTNLPFARSLIEHCKKTRMPDLSNLITKVLEERMISYDEQSHWDKTMGRDTEVLTFLLQESGISKESFEKLIAKAHEKFQGDIKARAEKHLAEEAMIKPEVKDGLEHMYDKAMEELAHAAATAPANIAPLPADKAAPVAAPPTPTAAEAPKNITPLPAQPAPEVTALKAETPQNMVNLAEVKKVKEAPVELPKAI